MRAGQLSERVTLQARSNAPDSYGQPVPTWSAAATLWAAVESVSGREYITASTEQAETTLRVTLRYRSVDAGTHRLLWRGRTLDIHAVLPYADRSHVTLMCGEGVNNG